MDDTIVDTTHIINEHVNNLNMVNHQLAELKRIKESLERKIIEMTGRAEFNEDGSIKTITREGSHQHIIDKYKVTIKTELLWKIDKEEYEVVASRLTNGLDPIRKSLKYEVNKATLRNLEKYGSNDDKNLVAQFMEMSFSKPNITLVVNS